nr:PREDICTED: zinc finger BED domain-containing protein 1-like [Bemisia tabaci]
MVKNCISMVTVTQQKSMTDGNSKSSKLTDAIVYMVAKDNLPFRSVEGVGFRKVMHVAAPHYKVPDRKKIAKLIEAKYETLRTKIQKVIDTLKIISLTTDIWQEEYTSKSYISLTGHYIDTNSGEMISVVLGAEPLDSNHTAAYIVEVLDKILSEWSIPRSKIGGCAADNGANIACAVKDMFGERRYIPCFSHTLNLAVCDSLEGIVEIQILVKRVKSAVTFCKKNVNAADMVRKSQVEKGVPEVDALKVIQSVDTRWNSLLDMLERFLLLSEHINAVFIRFDRVTEVFGSSDLALLREVVKLLQPCKEATVDLGGQKYATTSSVIPTVTCITQMLQSQKVTLEPAIALQQKLLSEIQSRFYATEKHRPHAISTILDPRFKQVYFQQAGAAASALSAIKSLLGK